jgi:hypothetical protein
LIGKQIALKKRKGAPKHIGSIQKRHQSKRRRKKQKTKKNKKKKERKKNTRKTQKTKEKLHQTPSFLPLTLLEPTPLASKLIEHSKFLTSLFPFFLFIFFSFLGGESES